MVTYAVQGPPHAGAQLTLSAPGGTIGDLAPTGQGIGLLVSNGGTPAMQVVLPIAPAYDGNLVISSRIVSCAGLTGGIPGLTLIPLPDSVYGPGTTAVQYSTLINMNVASVRIP